MGASMGSGVPWTPHRGPGGVGSIPGIQLGPGTRLIKYPTPLISSGTAIWQMAPDDDFQPFWPLRRAHKMAYFA